TEDPPLVQKLAPEVPLPFAEVIQRALQRDREKRYPTMREFREALLACNAVSAAVPGKLLGSQHTLQHINPPPASAIAAAPARAKVGNNYATMVAADSDPP